jgi:hypothetical protein
MPSDALTITGSMVTIDVLETWNAMEVRAVVDNA